MLRRIINNLVLHRDDVVIMDMEAGLEHLGRGTTESMDQFIVVIEPGARSVQTYKNVKRLADDLGVKQGTGGLPIRCETQKMKNLSEAVYRQRISWALFTIIQKLWMQIVRGKSPLRFQQYSKRRNHTN